MVNTNTKLSNNIRQKLSTKNISASELERRAGLKQSTLQNILYGRSRNPSIDTIKSIARELNCSIEELIGDLDYLNPNNPIKVEKHDKHDKHEKAEKEETEIWNASLFIKAIETVQSILETKKCQLPKKQILAAVDEVYKYSIGVSDEIDRRFAEWIIEKVQ